MSFNTSKLFQQCTAFYCYLCNIWNFIQKFHLTCRAAQNYFWVFSIRLLDAATSTNCHRNILQSPRKSEAGVVMGALSWSCHPMPKYSFSCHLPYVFGPHILANACLLFLSQSCYTKSHYLSFLKSPIIPLFNVENFNRPSDILNYHFLVNESKQYLRILMLHKQMFDQIHIIK